MSGIFFKIIQSGDGGGGLDTDETRSVLIIIEDA